MKRLIFTLFIVCFAIMAHAQATSLTVDCQNPGWLSSLIKYGDQQTVKNLKVTGYLNATDINFIGTLNDSRDLTGSLDLSEVTIVGTTINGKEYKENVFSGKMFRADGRDPVANKPKSLSKFILPKNAYEYSSCSSFWTRDSLIDTLVFEPTRIKYASSFLGGYYHVLVLGKEVDSIPDNAFNGYDYTKEYVLSNQTKYIGERAFFGNSFQKINWKDFKDNLNDIGQNAFILSTSKQTSNWSLDTLSLPNNQKFNIWHTESFAYKDGEHIYVPDNVKTIDCAETYGGTHDGHLPFRTYIHIKSANPPILENCRYGYKEITVYVPHGKSQNYKNYGIWKDCTILEEDPIHVDSVVVAEKEVTLNKIGETYQLHPIIYPTNAEIRDLTYTSSNSAVCVVRNDGLVTATGDGKCTIVVSAVDGGLPGICKITVNEETTGISSLEPENNGMPIEIYSVDGQRLSKLTKGINIIKQKGQKTKKVIIK